MRLGSALRWVLLCGAVAAHAQERIPPLSGRTLSGTAVTLPLQRPVTVLVLGFSQSARTDVTAWGKWLAGQYSEQSTVSFYEMPVVAGVPRLRRGWVLGRIRDGASQRGREHLLPVQDQEAEWRRAASFHRPDDAYVLLVDERGQILWKTSGGATPEQAAMVAGQIKALTKGR